MSKQAASRLRPKKATKPFLDHADRQRWLPAASWSARDLRPPGLHRGERQQAWRGSRSSGKERNNYNYNNYNSPVSSSGFSFFKQEPAALFFADFFLCILQPFIPSFIDDMCSRTQCPKCSKTSFSGCGMHLNSIFRDVPVDNLCACNSKVQAYAQQRREAGMLQTDTRAQGGCLVL